MQSDRSLLRWTTGLFIGTLAIMLETKRDPLEWKTAVYTQWSQVGLMGIIYVFILPETPWWHVRKGKAEQAKKTLRRLYGKIPGYDVDFEYQVIVDTVAREDAFAKESAEVPWSAIFKGINGVSPPLTCAGEDTADISGER